MVVERGPFLIMIRPKTRHETMLEFGWKLNPYGKGYIIDANSFIQKSEAQKWGEYVQQKIVAFGSEKADFGDIRLQKTTSTAKLGEVVKTL